MNNRMGKTYSSEEVEEIMESIDKEKKISFEEFKSSFTIPK